MKINDLLKPRFVDVQFDTAKLTTDGLENVSFDSSLEDSDTDDELKFVIDTGQKQNDLFIVDTKGSETNTQIEGPSSLEKQFIKTSLSDVRPSLYISSNEFSNSIKQTMRDINKHWAEEILLNRSVLKNDSEKEKQLVLRGSKKTERKHRRNEKEKTAGAEWFHMTKPELTDEKKKDLEILKMRKVIDTKTFYKKGDVQHLPKYFEVGTVVDNATDFYSDRIPKKQRKETLVDELLADNHFKQRNKRKYQEALQRQQYTSKKAYVQLKRIRRKEEAKQKKKQSVNK